MDLYVFSLFINNGLNQISVAECSIRVTVVTCRHLYIFPIRMFVNISVCMVCFNREY